MPPPLAFTKRKIVKRTSYRKLDPASPQAILEKAFDTLWRQNGGPELVEGFPFDAFWFDRSRPDLKIAIEIDGGIWSQGSHTRGLGYTRMCRKNNAAVLAGWRLFRLTSNMLEDDPYKHLQPIINLIRSESGEFR